MVDQIDSIVHPERDALGLKKRALFLVAGAGSQRHPPLPVHDSVPGETSTTARGVEQANDLPGTPRAAGHRGNLPVRCHVSGRDCADELRCAVGERATV
jgi:hypothetical protein